MDSRHAQGRYDVEAGAIGQAMGRISNWLV